MAEESQSLAGWQDGIDVTACTATVASAITRSSAVHVFVFLWGE